jgi:hypothetical protein
MVERGGHLIAANLGQQRAAIPAPGWGTAQPLAATGEATVESDTLLLGPDSAGVWSR